MLTYVLVAFACVLGCVSLVAAYLVGAVSERVYARERDREHATHLVAPSGRPVCGADSWRHVTLTRDVATCVRCLRDSREHAKASLPEIRKVEPSMPDGKIRMDLVDVDGEVFRLYEVTIRGGPVVVLGIDAPGGRSAMFAPTEAHTLADALVRFAERHSDRRQIRVQGSEA